MRIGLQSRFNVLVAETFGDQQDRYIHVDKQACVTVAQIVDEAGHTCGLQKQCLQRKADSLSRRHQERVQRGAYRSRKDRLPGLQKAGQNI